MTRLLLSATMLFLVGCASQGAGQTLLLQYEDFGPPSAVHELIGMDWWQWLEHGDSRPTDYDIRVVVYRHMELPEVRRMFPTDPSRELDYRYLEYTDAMRYLDRMIGENAIDSLTATLQATQLRIRSALGAVESRPY